MNPINPLPVNTFRCNQQGLEVDIYRHQDRYKVIVRCLDTQELHRQVRMFMNHYEAAKYAFEVLN